MYSQLGKISAFVMQNNKMQYDTTLEQDVWVFTEPLYNVVQMCWLYTPESHKNIKS